MTRDAAGRLVHLDGHVIVVDLGFGDCGKGAVVDRLCADGASLVVRFSGGAQAAHNVVVETGSGPDASRVHHCFHQMGSGTLAGVPTLLGPDFLLAPFELAGEVVELEAAGVSDPLSMLSVDTRALLSTPVHAAANRAREDARGPGRHGSTGQGIGETVAYAREHDAPRAADLARRSGRSGRAALVRKLDALARHYAPLVSGSAHSHPGVAEMADVLLALGEAVPVIDSATRAVLLAARSGRVVFEGSQGILLDEWNGFHPHTTWATVTPANARRIARAAGIETSVLGVSRTYLTRHGAGPFPSEDPSLAAVLPEAHNAAGTYQGGWRVGHLDEVLLRYAARAAGRLDAVALTHLDAPRDRLRAVTGYRYGTETVTSLPRIEISDEATTLSHQTVLTAALGAVTPLSEPLGDPVARIEAALGVPVVMSSHGPARHQIS